MWEPVRKAEKEGLVVSATDTTGDIINAIEIKDRSWMVGTQYHPEFNSRPDNPNPVYLAFVKSMLEKHQKKSQH